MTTQDNAQPLHLCMQDFGDINPETCGSFDDPPTDQMADPLALKWKDVNPVGATYAIKTLWPLGKTLRVGFLGGATPDLISRVKTYASLWTKYANVDFVYPSSGTYEIRVNFDSSGLSWSTVGTAATYKSQSEATMNFGWFNDSTIEAEYERVIVHEFGHAIGMVHEQANPSQNIQWNKQAVYDYYAHQNPPWSSQKVDLNYFAVYQPFQVYYTPWDSRSIMQYSVPASFTMNGMSIPENTTMDATDESWASSVYPMLNRDAGTWKALNNAQTNTISFTFNSPYHSVPKVVTGLNFLDIAQSADTTINASVDQVSSTGMGLSLNSWGNTIQYGSGMTWLETSTMPNRSMFQVGTARVPSPGTESSQTIVFDPPIVPTTDVAVICWINLMNISMGSLDRTLSAEPTAISPNQFTLTFQSWGRSFYNDARCSWIAFDSGSPGIAWGVCLLENLTRGQGASQTVTFPSNTFTKPPLVLVAFSSINCPSTNPVMRLRTQASNISNTGCTISAYGWADSFLGSVIVSWIAVTS